MKLKSLLIAATVLALPILSIAVQSRDNDEHGNHQAAPADASVDFGVLPTGPLGPPPCLQTGAIGGPADPCSYKLHRLTPAESTVGKGGQVTFQIHGGGHGLAIYKVSADTTREGIGQLLCPGQDPATITDPTKHTCNLSASNANALHRVHDGDGEVVYVAQPNVTNQFPDNRVWSEPGRLVSAGGRQFLNGGTTPAGATSDGQLITYRFLKPGRYLVICMNRTHHLNDWMFGFVTVTGDD
jgi:plastocyanin